MPTVHLVRSPKRWLKIWAQCRAIWIVETDPKTQCKECLLYWSQGIVYCTCGHLLKESEASRAAIQCTLDLVSIQNYVIKKGRPHCHRYGKTKEQRDYHVAHNLRERCIKRHLKGIHARFLRDPEFRESELNVIELKKSVSRWANVRRKISPIIRRKQSTFDTERIGVSLSIIPEKPDRWEIVLTSTMRWRQ